MRMGNVNLIGVLISCLIAVLVLIEPFIIHKTKKRKLHSRSYWYDHIQADNNELPKHIKWDEINSFLEDTEYGLNMPDDSWFMKNWAIQPCAKNGKLSKNSFRVLECLSKDMKHLFYQVVVYYDRGPEVEDRRTKYQYVKELLDTKYDKLSANLREMIYGQFVTEYEKRKNNKDSDKLRT